MILKRVEKMGCRCNKTKDLEKLKRKQKARMKALKKAAKLKKRAQIGG